ncbi:prepilin-type N-terminal cleavage/methylation domain-containing protein [Geobacter pelophilus]|uniref:Type II secretion system protein J n=1 Tax=Geoanaerobacter pelophilus TaxID=60036 RepID=A0AAW4L047_9BACT|nr:type II secretion system protein GspJ [Geoanaerobacter pelophilus]MBT0664034.1 prepilin-type N-terminal cleavage/methylation domain-containing protein [Geoanaerobacter pelophilus]
MTASLRRQPQRCRGPGKGAAGFTLLEVLVALALLAIIASALYGSYFTLFKGKETTVAAMDQRRAVRETLDLLRRELSSSWYRSGKPLTPFVVEDRDQFGKPASRLAFVTIAPPVAGGQPVSDQLAVEYTTVAREEMLDLNRSAQDLHKSAKPMPYPQIEKIEGFLVECSSDGSKWVKSWDTAINGNLPKAVRVTLQVKEGNNTVGYSTLATLRMAPQ